MSDDQKFRDKAEREIFAATMEARIRQCPFETADEVASRAWAMVKAYRARCAEPAVEPDAGPTESDIRGEVDHGD